MKNLILIIVSLLLIFGWGFKVSAQSCPTTLAQVPIPVDIDGVTMVASRFYLNVPFGACGMTFSRVKPKTSEASARGIAQALISGNFKGYRETFSHQADTNEAFIKTFFDHQSSIFQKDQPDRIAQKYKLGILDYFVMGNASHPFLDSLLVVQTAGKGYYNGRSYTLNPVVENLDAAVRLLPDQFTAFPDPPEGRYYQVADVLPNDNGSVTCAFQGQIMDMDIMKEPLSNYTGPYGGLMAFYQSSFLNLANRKQEDYLKGFSPASRKQEEAMMADGGFEHFAWFETMPIRKVEFILDADPVYFIFWHSADGDSCKYDTILKTAVDANPSQVNFQRVNIQHETTIGHLLGDQTFADNLQTMMENAE